MRLDDLFDVKNGLASSAVKIFKQPSESLIPYVRPASTQRRTIAGWVAKSNIVAPHIYPSGTIFVSTNGEGSHTYSYVSSFDFVPNSDVSVLLPKTEMSLNARIYYARCITMNRYRFSYGRKPKGERLKQIVLPDHAPAWVDDFSADKALVIGQPQSLISTPAISTNTWGAFKLGELFDIKKGQRLTKANMLPGKVPYVGASDSFNGVTAHIGQDPIHKAGTISVSYNGSVAEAFYQPVNYWATDDVNVLYPKGFMLTPASALFICTIIRMEKYRFNYGRKWHLDRMRDSVIKLPVTAQGQPDWKFMEQYIKTLPYSSQIDAS